MSWPKTTRWAIICACRADRPRTEVVLYDHPLQMDLTARIKEANDQGKPPTLDIHVLPRDKHWQKHTCR